MANKKKLGGDGVLARNSGSYGSPTWNTITECESLALQLKKNTGEFRTRASAYVLKRGGKIEALVEFKLVYDPGDDDWTVLRDAFLNGTAIEFMVFDGAIATVGNQGLRASFEVVELPLDQPLEEGMSVAVVLAAAISDNAPAWVTTS